jgi:hypothetical protein
MIDRALAAVLLERQGSFLMWRLMMPWKPIDPARAERERMRRKAMEAARPKGHNRAYKTARWLRIRAEKLFADPDASSVIPSLRPKSTTSTAMPGTTVGKTYEAPANPAIPRAPCGNKSAGEASRSHLLSSIDGG